MAWEMGLKTTYYLRTLGASQVEKASVSTAEYGATHLRGGNVQAEAYVASASIAPEAAPSIPSGFTPEEWQQKVARVAAGEESGVCESCES